jgi:hypothetical protein
MYSIEEDFNASFQDKASLIYHKITGTALIATNFATGLTNHEKSKAWTFYVDCKCC